MPEFLFDPTFWLSVGQIILIDILLGGDNAVVIALACRKLPEEQRRKGIFWGVAGAIGLRVVLIFGWTGGKLLVSSSYTDAKVKAKEMKDSRGKGQDLLGDEGEPATDA